MRAELCSFQLKTSVKWKNIGIEPIRLTFVGEYGIASHRILESGRREDEYRQIAAHHGKAK
jgi:hypothetical protein